VEIVAFTLTYCFSLRAMSHYRRRYYVLEETCGTTEIPRMMCRVVTDVQLPLFKYAPPEPLSLASSTAKPERAHNPADLIKNLLSKPSLTTNRKDVLDNVKDASIKTSLSKLFGLEGSLKNEEKVKLETKEVRRYTLNNPELYFKTLMDDELYARDVRALLGETKWREAYLVVGFLTTSNATFDRTSNRNAGFEGHGTVPVTEALGAPPVPGLDLDPELSAKIKAERKLETAHTMSPDEEIFAVAYITIKGPKFRKNSGKPKPIGRPKVASAKHLAFGEDDDDDEDEDDEEEDYDNQEDEDQEIKLVEEAKEGSLPDEHFKF